MTNESHTDDSNTLGKERIGLSSAQAPPTDYQGEIDRVAPQRFASVDVLATGDVEFIGPRRFEWIQSDTLMEVRR